MKNLLTTTACIACLFFAALGCKGNAYPSSSTKLKDDIRIDGLDVSGMTVASAETLIETAATKRLDDTRITLLLNGQPTLFSAVALGAVARPEPAIQAAAKLRRRDAARTLTSAIDVDADILHSILSSYADSFSQTVLDASVSIDPTQAVPVYYHAERAGVVIDLPKLTETVKGALLVGGDQTIDVPYRAIEPAVTEASIRESFSPISTFTTSFDSATYSKPNRVHNIRKAAQRINGMLLADGETFDCNLVLGDRTAENGWKQAPGIRNGRYVDEYGGGVCQASSTLYNAVLMADLAVTERHAHSWPMGYVDIGCDATISTGGKNFCFVNNSGADVRIFMHIDEEQKTLTASIYGRPLQGNGSIRVVSERTSTSETATEQIMLDESLPYNTRIVERESRNGKTSVTYKENYSASGELMEKTVVSRDTYHAIDGLTYVSTDIFYS